MKYYFSNDGKIKLYQEDCFNVMQKLICNGIKIDCVICDLPQNITQNKWDNELDLEKMWDLLLKLRKDKSTPIILFSNQPYTTKLISSNLKMFKYCKYWQKDRPSGFLNAKRQPLRDIEDIVIFYEKQCTYNPQMTEGKPLHSLGTAYKNKEGKNNNYNSFNSTNELRDERKGTTEKYPRQLMKYNRPHPPIHPTEKAVDLIIDLIKTYTNEDDLILDFTIGSGSTAVASKLTNRKCIGIELNEDYFNIAVERIKNI